MCVCICSHTDTHKHRRAKDRGINGFNHKVLLSYLSVETQGRDQWPQLLWLIISHCGHGEGRLSPHYHRTPSLCTWEKKTHTFSGPGSFFHSQSLWEDGDDDHTQVLGLSFCKTISRAEARAGPLAPTHVAHNAKSPRQQQTLPAPFCYGLLLFNWQMKLYAFICVRHDILMHMPTMEWLNWANWPQNYFIGLSFCAENT